MITFTYGNPPTMEQYDEDELNVLIEEGYMSQEELRKAMMHNEALRSYPVS